MRLSAETIARGWIDLQSISSNSSEYNLGAWAEDALTEVIRAGGEYSWEVVQKISDLAKTEKEIGMFAAGPLEDFISAHGSTMINRIEKKAREDKAFNHALGGVWKSNTPDEIWDRIESARNAAW